MKLSLCAIVKDDELLVRKMLDSAIDVVDEVVIADTGSTDSTWDVLEKFREEYPDKVKLLHFEWVNDFSAARNFTIDHASGDWILVVDADEFLDANEKKGLRSFLDQTTADGVLLVQRNYTGSMKQFGSVLDVDTVRVFRRQYRFEFPIHEQVSTSIHRESGSFSRFQLCLHHVGYTMEYQLLKGKHARNLSMLEAQYEAMDDDDPNMRWFTATNLMAEYNSIRAFEKTRSLSRKVLDEIKSVDLKNPPVFLARIYKFRVAALMALGEVDLAIRESKNAVQSLPENADLSVLLGESLFVKGFYADSLKSLSRARSIRAPQHSVIEYTEGSQTYLSSTKIAECWFRLGDDLAALEWYARAYTENPEYPGVIPMIALLSQEPKVLQEMWPLIRTERRAFEWLDSYSLYKTNDCEQYILGIERKYGSSETTKRARFANALRASQAIKLSDSPTEWDYLRQGLYEYERGSRERAVENFKWAGEVGEYVIRVMKECGDQESKAKWNVAPLFQELISLGAAGFLRDHAHAIGDLKKWFPFLLHTEVVSAFTSPSYLLKDGTCPEEWEWQAQVYQALGKYQAAEEKLRVALLADGHYSVRAYGILASLHPENEGKYIAEARELYPTSKTIRMWWSTQFADKIRRVM